MGSPGEQGLKSGEVKGGGHKAPCLRVSGCAQWRGPHKDSQTSRMGAWDSTVPWLPGPPDLSRVGTRTCSIQKYRFWDAQTPPRDLGARSPSRGHFRTPLWPPPCCTPPPRTPVPGGPAWPPRRLGRRGAAWAAGTAPPLAPAATQLQKEGCAVNLHPPTRGWNDWGRGSRGPRCLCVWDAPGS